MKISILCENSVGHQMAKYCLAQWGLSLYVQTEGVNILFDTGHTEVYKHNAKQLKIDLNKTHFIVLSHYHWDHTGGLRFYNLKSKKKIILHPQILDKLPLDESKNIKNHFKVITSSKPFELSKNIYYLGEIPRKTSFEKGGYNDDPMLDDSAMAIKTTKGAVVITGCSHSGICNICEYAKKITGQKLYAVIGGFHLFDNDKEAIKATINYFSNERSKYLFPMHCVTLPALAEFYRNFGCKKYSSGDIIQLN
jgi:7,8-dihydropterin-6-yl-methyl-4-(beta-D-ribofuranosyl)aminobenzene 5'-phosphate synthase